MVRKTRSVTKLTKEEYERSTGKKAPRKKAAPVKKAEPAPVPLAQPIVPQDNQPIVDAINATNEIAKVISVSSFEQSQQVSNSLVSLSGALTNLANKPTWSKIRIEVDRGRDDLIKGANMIKVE